MRSPLLLSVFAVLLLAAPAAFAVATTVSVVPSDQAILRSASEITFDVNTDLSSGFTWTGSLTLTDMAGNAGGACDGTAACAPLDCTLKVGTTFNCTCVYSFSSTANGDACQIAVTALSDSSTTPSTFAGAVVVGHLINATLALSSPGTLPVVDISASGATTDVVISGQGLPSDNAEWSTWSSFAVSLAPFGSDGVCSLANISGVTVVVGVPGASAVLTLPTSSLTDGCKVVVNVTRLGQTSDNVPVAVVVAGTPTLIAQPTRGLAISANTQQLTLPGTNLPRVASELSNAAVTFSWACATTEAVPVCASPVVTPTEITCSVTVSNSTLHLCGLQASVSRFGLNTGAALVAVPVVPLDLVAPVSNETLIPGSTEKVFNATFAREATLTADELANSAVALVLSGSDTNCTLTALQFITAVYENNIQFNVSVPSTIAAGCSLSAAIELYGISGASAIVANTASRVTDPIYVIISGSVFPVSAQVTNITNKFAEVLQLQSSDLSGSLLSSKKRVSAQYYIEVMFVTEAAILVRSGLPYNTGVAASLLASVAPATLNLYTGVGIEYSAPAAPVAAPQANQTESAPVNETVPFHDPLENQGGIMGGYIAAAVLAGIVGLLIIIFIIYFVAKSRRQVVKQQYTKPASSAGSSASAGAHNNYDSTLLVDRDKIVEMEARDRARQKNRQAELQEAAADEMVNVLIDSDEEEAARKPRSKKSKKKQKEPSTESSSSS